MSIDTRELRRQLQSLDFGDGLTRDELRQRVPELPSEVYMYLPSMKKLLSPEDVLRNTGENAQVRAEGEFVEGDLDLPVEGAVEDGGPPAFGHTLSVADDTVGAAGNYPGPMDDLAGNSLETRSGRGIPDEYQGNPRADV